MHGAGRIQTPDGAVVEGEFRRGKLQAAGKRLEAEATDSPTDDYDRVAARDRMMQHGKQSRSKVGRREHSSGQLGFII